MVVLKSHHSTSVKCSTRPTDPSPMSHYCESATDFIYQPLMRAVNLKDHKNKRIKKAEFKVMSGNGMCEPIKDKSENLT